MSNYPHIKDNPWLALENCNLIFLDERNDEGDKKTCSIVVRLTPSFVNGEQQPLRFEKRSRIQKDEKNEKGIRDYQVVHEDQVFRIMQQSNISIAKIPQRLNVYEYADGDHILITKDAGLDASKWCEFPLFLKRNNRQYSHVFCHPLALLYFIKGTLLALYEIHKIGLFHCDIKLDQICIPFNKQGSQITLDFHNITLIDFGIAIWEMVPVAYRNPVRFTSGNMKKGNYAADILIDAGDYQKNIFKTKERFDFNALLEQIDCAVDLYSFGFMLDGLEVARYPEDGQAWRSFRSEYEAWVDELLSLSNKKTPFKNNLPHQQYIDKIDGWIAKTTKILGYGIGELRFDLVKQKTTPPVGKITPIPTPMPDDIGLEVKQTPIITRTPLLEFVQDYQYDGAWIFSEGLAVVEKNGKYGFIDKTGRTVIGFEYDWARSFSEGLAFVKKNGKYGFIDKTGRTVIGFEYDNAWEFSEGLAVVEKNGKYGFIDKAGRTVIGFEYDYVSDFSEGLAVVKKNGKYGFIDKTGRTVIGFEYDDVSDFSEGLAVVKKNGKWGFIDKAGRTVIGFEYDRAENFLDGLAIVKKNGKYGFIRPLSKLL